MVLTSLIGHPRRDNGAAVSISPSGSSAFRSDRRSR